MRITLKPFGPVDGGVLVCLVEHLNRFGPVDVAPPSAVPENAFDRKRGQYYATGFFERCREEPGDRVLAVTHVDLYEPGYRYVFGAASLQDRYGVISIARLGGDGAERLRERALKESLHELGHTFGLPHDPDPLCVMHFSNNLGDTDRKGAHFCARCEEQVTVLVKRLGT